MPEVEELRALWSKVLGVAVTGETHFFVAGGDSLSGALLNTQTNTRFGVDLTLRQLFDHATFDEYCQVVGTALAAGRRSEMAGLPEGEHRAARSDR
jgi:hypothetical protein